MEGKEVKGQRCDKVHFMFAPMSMSLKSYHLSRGSAIIGSDYIDHGQGSIL